MNITGTTGLYGLLGSPVSHSISPLMHNTAFELLGIDSVYLCFEVAEQSLPEAVSGLRACGIQGFNLTMPCKTAILPLLDSLSPAAEMIGAVNTVVNENGRLVGHNTDGVGFMRSLAEEGFDIEGKTVTLLGAGGAATAICAQAALDGAAVIHQFVRTGSRFRSRAERLAKQISSTLPCRVLIHEYSDRQALRSAAGESQILINGTSVGMAPDPDASPLVDPSILRPDLFAADVIYNPRETRFLKAAREKGAGTMNGMYMLLYQGAEAFRLWTGRDMPVKEIKARFFT